jgi:hypothetical protein
MNSDLSSLEAQLRELRAVPLDDAFLTRLEDAAEGSLSALSSAQEGFEARLRNNSPLPLSADFLASLETILTGVPFPGEVKIVPFPRNRPVEVAAPRKRPIWAAAAAVALIGAASALWMPNEKPTAQLTQSTTPSAPLVAVSNLVPASYNRGVSEVHDEGVVWKSKTQPHNLVRVVYKDRITLKDDKGRTYQVEQPRVEYLLVPAKTD